MRQGLSNIGKERSVSKGEPLQSLTMFTYLCKESKVFKTAISISRHLEGRTEMSHKLSFKLQQERQEYKILMIINNESEFDHCRMTSLSFYVFL